VRERARALRAAFARYDGPAVACDVIEQLSTGA
jgi:UDP:flavonoid glycosyltransferase YjiC (YdhE family)